MAIDLLLIIQRIPEGYNIVSFKGKKYGLVKNIFNKGKSFKVYANELGGTDFISLNYYCLKNGDALKPCEMSEEKVVNFLKNFKLDSELKDHEQ